MTPQFGQSGTITIQQDGNGQWHHVTFDTAIENAIAVLGPLTRNGADPLTTRVRNVTDTGFEFQLDEWNYLDDWNISEIVSWLAIPEGTHTLATGQKIVAGAQPENVTFRDVSFGDSLEDAIVLTEVTSVNGPDAVTTRVRNVTDTGFQEQLEEEEALGAIWTKPSRGS